MLISGYFAAPLDVKMAVLVDLKQKHILIFNF